MAMRRVVLQEPPALAENVPCAELELRLTLTLRAAVTGVPAPFCSWTVIAPDGAPAVSVWAALVKTNVCWPQSWNVFQASLNQAPSIWPLHHRFWPNGPHAPMPGSFGSTVSAESWIAVASRSRIAPVWFVKSVDESPSELFGAHAKPQRS